MKIFFLNWSISLALLVGVLLIGSLPGFLNSSARALAGWSFFLTCALFCWLTRIPTENIYPLLILLTAGLAFLSLLKKKHQIEWAPLLGAGVFIGFVFAVPFLLNKNVLIYSWDGTDMWGYLRVSEWLKEHPVSVFPDVTCHPALAWTWLMLDMKDRPLAYMLLSVVGSIFRVKTSVVYYPIFSAFLGSVAYSVYQDFKRYVKFEKKWFFLVALFSVFQSALMIHVLRQFYAGSLTALIFTLTCLSLLSYRRPTQERGVKSVVLLASLILYVGSLLGGFYSFSLSSLLWFLAGTFVVSAFFEYSIPFRWKNIRSLWPLLVAGAIVLAISFISEPLVIGNRVGLSRCKVGHVWAQLGGLFGLTDVLPWYFQDNEIWAPVTHKPRGIKAGIVLLFVSGAFLLYQAWVFWKQRRSFVFGVIVLSCYACLAYSAPPLGAHQVLSRTLPVFGGALLFLGITSVQLRQPRWLQILACFFILFPVFRGSSFLVKELVHPTKQAFVYESAPNLKGDLWDCKAKAYFYDHQYALDWSQNPMCFNFLKNLLPKEIEVRAKCELEPAKK